MASNGSLSHRIRMEGPEDEFRELADVFDTMLVQLESHVTEQQRFTAERLQRTAHPAGTQTLLDVARNDPTRDQGELIERLHTVNTRAIDLTEALLLLSRGDRRSSPASPSTSPSSPKKPPKRCFPSPNSAGSRSTSPARQHRPSAPAALILRMVTNLVQNAIVHNLAAGGTVAVHTESQHDASVLRVENTGHPLPSELVPTLTEPFQREQNAYAPTSMPASASGWPSCTASSKRTTGPSTSHPAPPAVSSSRFDFPARRRHRPRAAPTRR